MDNNSTYIILTSTESTKYHACKELERRVNTYLSSGYETTGDINCYRDYKNILNLTTCHQAVIKKDKNNKKNK